MASMCATTPLLEASTFLKDHLADQCSTERQQRLIARYVGPINQLPEKPQLYADRPKSTKIHLPNMRTMAAVSGAARTLPQGAELQTAGEIRTPTVVEGLGVNDTTVLEQDRAPHLILGGLSEHWLQRIT